MSERRKILFSVRRLQRLRVEPGFPREAVPALHICPDGLLFKDAFVSFDEISALEAPDELSLADPRLGGQEAAIPLGPGQGCLVLRRGPSGQSDVVFLVEDAAGLREKMSEIWARHRQDLPDGWRRLRDHGFSICCPLDWQAEETRHPHLRMRLFSQQDGVMANVLLYERTEEADLAAVVSGLLASLRQQYDDLHIVGRGKIEIAGFSGERLVVEERSSKPPVVSDTFLLLCPKQIVEIQFLLPADRYKQARPTLEKVAFAFRWQ